MPKAKVKKYANMNRIVDAVEKLSKILIEEGIIEPSEWHTIEFYARTQDYNAQSFWIDEIKVSNIKRDMKGTENLEGISFPYRCGELHGNSKKRKK